MLLPEYIKSDYVAPVDLTTTGKMFDTLQQRHDKAVETESQLRIAINEMDMNEAEDGFKQGLVDTINNMVAENVENYNGYKGYGLNDLVNATGKIMGSPAVKGRLEAQKAWKTNNALLDELALKGEINQDIAEMYKELNPYSYNDIRDNNDNIIGGTRWQANFQPVKQFDLNDVIKEAAKYVNPDTIGYGGTLMLDVNGKRTDNILEAIAFKNSEGFTEELTEDKIRQALNAAYRSNAKYEASFDQDFELAKWYYEKYGEDKYNWHFPDGVEMTKSEYLDSKFEPFVQSYKYRKSTSKSSLAPNTSRGVTNLNLGGGDDSLTAKGNKTIANEGYIQTSVDVGKTAKEVIKEADDYATETLNYVNGLLEDVPQSRIDSVINVING